MFDQRQDRVGRAVQGDALALQELLLEHYDRLRLHLSEKMPADLSGQLSLDDVLQEALAEAVRQVSGFRAGTETAFFRWLATIAEHRLIDLCRAARAAKRGGGWAAVEGGGLPESSVAELVSLLVINERTPSRSMAGREAALALQRAIESLKDDYREVLQWRYYRGLSVEETAAQMGRTVTAIQMLCHRALRELREQMGDPARYLSWGA